MRTLITILLLYLISLNGFSIIRRVNNNPGITLPAFGYTTFSAAMSAVPATGGDTIYLEPSNINYGPISINKKITLIGPGYLLDQNSGTPHDKRSATVESINISGNISGVQIFGITVRNVTEFGKINFSATIKDCVFSRNLFGGFSSSNIHQNLIVSQNFIIGNSNFSSYIDGVISNNIIIGKFSLDHGIFKNNILYDVPQTFDHDVEYYNNIFVGTGKITDVLSGTNVYNNVCINCTGTVPYNNFYTNSYSTVFLAPEPKVLDDLEDGRFQLPTSSPAKAKGVGGIDCGVFSGPNPYVLSGLPPVPLISAISVGTATGGNIPVTFTTRRNN